MPYLGNVPAEAYTNTVKDSFNGDASTTAFTLSQPSSANNLRVVVENVIQDPTVAYTVSGTTLTFTSAPPVGTANIYAVHLGPAVQTAVPPSEINNATTYTSDLTVQGAFTSAGIDDNADATAITIDSSENVFIGTTSGSHKLNVNGSGYFNYTVVDNGGVRNGFSGASGVTFSSTGTRPTNNAGTPTDNTYDLGHSSVRWKDLYLSGGVYVGGTGSANYLDDYEEGTWSPTIVGSSGASGQSYVAQNGNYTKIGRFCHLTFDCQLSTVGTLTGTYVVLGGLPFTPLGSNIGGGMLTTYSTGWNGLADPYITAYVSGSTVYLMNGTNDYIRIGDNNHTNSSRLIGTMSLVLT